jgi:UDPglucose--hexose-1-phosphate uridylyltransferase
VFRPEPAGGLRHHAHARHELLLEVWADRTRELGEQTGIEYVMPFENRGVEMGVTLSHPHGQIYAYPFVPPVAARQGEEERRFRDRHGSTLLEHHIDAEMSDGRRILYAGERVVAFVPAFARYPYEVWVAPIRAVASLTDLDPTTRADFARALKTVVLKYDGIRAVFPYLMVFHQAPTDGARHPEAHLHVEFSPALRAPDRLKILAGTELGAGMFTNDTLPEAKAAELQAVPAALEEHTS